MEEWNLSDKDWREIETNEKVMLESGMIVYEKEIYLALEKLIPLLLETQDRYPTETDIELFILGLRQ